MSGIDPEVMLRQTDALAADFERLAPQLAHDVSALAGRLALSTIERVTVVGNGDSFHAGCAAAFAFDSLAGLACEVSPAEPFVSYGMTTCRTAESRRLVVGCSASGSSPRVVRALAGARAAGMPTLAITGTPDSELTRAAEYTLPVPLLLRERSPGIRTYQASLMALLSLALERAGDMDAREAFAGMAKAIADTLAQDVALEPLADALATSPVMMVLGTGPSLGTARFCAAKFVEGAGLFAVAQDLEEWWHVERFAQPFDLPLIVLAPPGQSHARVAELATKARALGRRVFVVAASDDPLLSAGPGLPVRWRGPEVFSPLVYHLFASRTACLVARRLGRRPFQADRAV